MPVLTCTPQRAVQLGAVHSCHGPPSRSVRFVLGGCVHDHDAHGAGCGSSGVSDAAVSCDEFMRSLPSKCPAAPLLGLLFFSLFSTCSLRQSLSAHLLLFRVFAHHTCSYARRGGTLNAGEPVTMQRAGHSHQRGCAAGHAGAVPVEHERGHTGKPREVGGVGGGRREKNQISFVPVCLPQVFLELVAPHRFKPLPHMARTLGANLPGGGDFDEATQPLLEGQEEEEE